MRKSEGKIVGLLSAVIIHLIAAIIFMLVKVGNLNIREYAREYEILLEETLPPEDQKMSVIRNGQSIYQIVSDDQELLNIARNLSRQPDVNIDRDDYIDMVKEEMISEGKLGKENYIDEWKNRDNSEADEGLVLENRVSDREKEAETSRSNELASKYSGPTRIYYELKGRVHAWLPLPIYKCEGAGKIVLAIEVNQKGAVTNAFVIESESTTSDICLVETAMKTALISKFNADSGAPKSQTGTLTYHFVAQ